ncbi:MAG: hypothetical protein IJ721_05260 [Bacteroidales bacterium]|nr:hypothetical protein [Bacteroidales bacterium]
MRRIPTTAISTISTQNGGDWTLRAAVLPAGKYDLVMRFEPDSYRSGTRISRASSLTLLAFTAVLLTRVEKK